MRQVFIGYDARESIAFHVCANSIIRHSSRPMAITPLSLNNLSGYTENHSRAVGYKPTNDFIFSRFLVPELAGYKGWALFIDGDMIFLDDPTKLFALADESKAVMCVKHVYKTKFPVKYLGQKNEDYERKNWSSVMLFNCAHPDCMKLTKSYVQHATGKHLHRFEWTDDENIGELPIQWNWLPDEFGPNENAKLLHFTAGTPCFHDFACSPMADLWHKERMLTNYSAQV